MTEPRRWVDAEGDPPPPHIAEAFAAADQPDHPLLPTPEQCDTRAQVGDHLWAFWWPSMGGYAGRAVVRSAPDDCCQTIWLWHDGEFPNDDHPKRFTIDDPGELVSAGEFLSTLPGPDADEHAAAPDRYMMATTAIHKLGDLSRDEPSLAIIYGEADTDWIGEWATGVGLVNVRFPKGATRELTDAEKQDYSGKVIETGGMARPIRIEPEATQ